VRHHFILAAGAAGERGCSRFQAEAASG
jgi:hypothetical protein